jgi:dTDP-4-amino-4,6-dideoxygalactose transaminase
MIPLFGVQRQTERLRAAFDTRMAAVLDHGRFILGPEVEELETRLAAWCGAAHAVGVGSGWDALFIALAGEGIGPGDAVFVPAFTFTATADAVVACGATPVFVDVEPESCNMDPARLAETVAAVRRAGALTPRAVIPVDLFGYPADYAGLSDAAPGLFQLADAAQAFGAERAGKRAGAMAAATAFSFYPTKPLGALGDGGAITTDDPERAARWRSIRNWGRGPDGRQHADHGPTARLDTLQAAVLLEKLAAFDAELARRRAVAARYTAALSGLVETPPPDGPGAASAWALYTIRTANRDALRERLSAMGVPTAIYYPAALPAHPAFARHAPAPGSLPVSESLSGRVVSLPMHAELTEAEVDAVCAAAAEALAP